MYKRKDKDNKNQQWSLVPAQSVGGQPGQNGQPGQHGQTGQHGQDGQHGQQPIYGQPQQHTSSGNVPYYPPPNYPTGQQQSQPSYGHQSQQQGGGNVPYYPPPAGGMGGYGPPDDQNANYRRD